MFFYFNSLVATDSSTSTTRAILVDERKLAVALGEVPALKVPLNVKSAPGSWARKYRTRGESSSHSCADARVFSTVVRSLKASGL